jgi:hypothetical protein
MQVGAKEQVKQLDLSRFGHCAVSCFDKIRVLARRDDAAAAELQDKFLPAIHDIEEVVVDQIEPCFGAFKVEGSRLTIAVDPIIRLLAFVAKDLATAPPLQQDEILRLYDKVFLVYLLHETRHRTQGVGLYPDVQALKKIAGSASMSEIDVLADRDAAFAYGLVQADGRGRRDYLVAFQEAIWFSITYYFKAFPFANDRVDKLARVCAIYIMAARLAVADLGNKLESSDFPLDAPIQVKLSGCKGVAIFRAEPSLKLLAADNDADLIPRLLAAARAGQVEEALMYASRTVLRFRLAA